GGTAAPAVFFGATKMNNNFTLVDQIVKEVGGTATIFVRSGSDYIRVATNVKKEGGSRAIGTILEPKGKGVEVINNSKEFYGAGEDRRQPLFEGLRADTRCTQQRHRHLLFWLHSKRFLGRTLTN